MNSLNEKKTYIFPNAPEPHQQWSEQQMKDMIAFGVACKMSDIKIIPDQPPFMRVYGKWVPLTRTPVHENDIERMLVWTSGASGLPARVKNGDFADYAYDLVSDEARGLRRRFRCNATGCMANGSQSGISLVMRKIPDKIPTLEDCDLEDGKKVGYIVRHMFPQQGIVLFTGPTGSGKTTTLAAGVGYHLLTRPDVSLETYEDPVEFDYSMVKGDGPLIQISMQEHLRGDFQKIAPNAARRSSDIVIVGESRDKESFRGLIQLADMGMLTISTLHTRSVAETPSRILNTFTADERPEVKASLLHGLRFVVQQRLLPTVDGKRVAVREWLVFNEKLRYELSNMDVPEMIPHIRKAVERQGKLLINDVRDKYSKGLIHKKTLDVMEAENADVTKSMARGGHVG